MCTHYKYVNSTSLHRQLLLKCGKCDACRQEFAFSVSNRIRNTLGDGDVCLFVTLTYSPLFVPYVLRSDVASSRHNLQVFRDAEVRVNPSGHGITVTPGTVVIDDVLVDNPHAYDSPFDIYKCPNGSVDSKEKIAVCYYKDSQNFFKRLRQNLSRKHGYDGKFRYFCCSEYGSSTLRPHFHALLFFPERYEKIFRDAICESWSFADKRRTSQYIEVARDAASYVASYVNKSGRIPSLLDSRPFKQNHSYSQDFGVSNSNLQLPKVLEMVERRDLGYDSFRLKGGIPCVSRVYVPKYALNRFFPKFKGFGRLSLAAQFQVVLRPQILYRTTASTLAYDLFVDCNDVLTSCQFGLLPWTEYDADEFIRFSNEVGFNAKDLHSVCVMLDNAFVRFSEVTGLGRYDFAYYYVTAWYLYNMSLLRRFYEEQFDSPVLFAYDNMDEFLTGRVSSIDLALFCRNDFFSRDFLSRVSFFSVDDNPRNIEKTSRLTDLYNSYNKFKRSNNVVMSIIGHFV